MDRISRHTQGVEGVQLGDLRIGSQLFADDVVLLTSSSRDLQLSLDGLPAECEAAGIRISTSKFESMVLSQKRLGLGWDPAPSGGVQVPRGLVHK